MAVIPRVRKHAPVVVAVVVLALVLMLSMSGSWCNAQPGAEGDITKPRARPAKPLRTLVVIGATGNLAAKYVWQAVFNNWLNERSQESLLVIAAARAPEDEGAALVRDIITKNVSSAAMGRPAPGAKRAFRDGVVYMNVREADAYSKMHQSILDIAAERQQVPVDKVAELGRVFYLAVSPKVFVPIATQISNHARPSSSNAWLRVVFEKPFGRDGESADAMAAQLAPVLEPAEVRLVDHYLGKDTVHVIRSLREANRYTKFGWHLRPGNASVRAIEAVMREEEDCGSRTRFYDDYGVVRDTMQNHMTQMVLMSLSAVHRGAEPHSVQRQEIIEGLHLARSTEEPVGSGTQLRQYKAYQSHVEAETGRQGSAIATAASVRGIATAGIWPGVPVLLVAGKDLGRKQTYLRLILNHKVCNKKDYYCATTPLATPEKEAVPGCGAREQQKNPSTGQHPCYADIVFHISEFGMLDGCVSLHPSLPEPKLPFGWEYDGMASRQHGRWIARRMIADFAYSEVIKAAMGPEEDSWDNFVSLDEVRRLWSAWTPLLEAVEDGTQPQLHEPGDMTWAWPADWWRGAGPVVVPNTEAQATTPQHTDL